MECSSRRARATLRRFKYARQNNVVSRITSKKKKKNKTERHTNVERPSSVLARATGWEDEKAIMSNNRPGGSGRVRNHAKSWRRDLRRKSLYQTSAGVHRRLGRTAVVVCWRPWRHDVRFGRCVRSANHSRRRCGRLFLVTALSFASHRPWPAHLLRVCPVSQQ